MMINNANILVTGANRGIGKALVESLISQGAAKVYAGVRDVSTVAELTSDRVIALQLDVTQTSSIANAASKANDVNVLINNAGVLSFGDILSVSDEQLKHNFAVNFYGALATSRAFVPVIEGNGSGAIVNMLTLLSLASMPGLAAYNAAKAAAWSMHLSLRASLADRGISVHGVFPGAVDTDMLADVDMPKTSPTEVAHAIIQGVIENRDDIFPDPMSRDVYDAWCKDHKAVEKQFAQM